MTDRAAAPIAKPGWTIWLTGLPASGKTTLALYLQQTLLNCRSSAILLDSDAVRGVLTPTPRYSAAERDDFYARLSLLAGLLAAQGFNVIVAATSNRRAHRDQARNRLPRFLEIWVRCSLAVCQARDPKGLYAQAAAGEIVDFPGLDAPYEPPLRPDLVVDSEAETPQAAADRILVSFPFLCSTTGEP
ncbi:MAG: adenylyl-sulfate kinase [Chloroflexota bacterium]|nr:adenylyl-sulfate kinase [Chloroflexota bacterium]